MTLEKSIAENGTVYAVDGEGEPFARIETITPDLAERWLKAMAPNRKVNPKHVEKLVRDMDAGRWMVSPQGIGFGRDGSLIDGQHRLQAVVRSGVSLRMLVVRNLDPNVMPAIDENRKRSFGDDLYIAQEANTSVTASAVLLIHRLEVGANRDLKVASLNNLVFSRFELHDVKIALEEESDVIAAVRAGMKLRSAIDVPPSAGSAAYYIGRKLYGEEFISDCYERLCTGRDLSEDSPLLTGRERFIKMNMIRPKPMGYIYAAALLRVLQAQYRGNSLKKILLTSIEAMRIRRLM